MFLDRTQAGKQLAARLKPLALLEPLVLGIPRGGVVTGAAIARELGAELDVVLVRKLRAPYQPELALGAIGEDGEAVLSPHAFEVPGVTRVYLHEERELQRAEIERRRKLYREARAAAPVVGRSLILTDDGVATGSTMLAALHVLNARKPREIIVAVPVASPVALAALRPHCGRIECLLAPGEFAAVGSFYRDFRQVEDSEVVRLLREPIPAPTTGH